MGAGSLHGAAPSRGWLPPRGGSLQRPNNHLPVGYRSEDPDLGGWESWWTMVGGGSKEEDSGRVNRSSGREGGKGELFVLRGRKMEEFFPVFEGPSPSLKKRTPPSSFVRSSTHSSKPKIVDGCVSSIFGAEDRRLEMQVLRSSAPENAGRGFFDLRSGKIEDGGFFEYERGCSKNPLSSKNPPIFVLRPQRSRKPHRRSSEPNIGSEIATSFVVNTTHLESKCIIFIFCIAET